MKERPEEALRSPLKLITASMEEEGQDEVAVSGAEHTSMLTEGVLEQCRLSRTRLSFDPEQSMIATGPAPVFLVAKQPLACSRDCAVNVMIATLHSQKG